MKAVLGFDDKNKVIYVTFEKRVDNPESILNQIVVDCGDKIPVDTNYSIDYESKIREDCRYLLYESSGNQISITETYSYQEAVEFLPVSKDAKKSKPTLKKLIDKYASINDGISVIPKTVLAFKDDCVYATFERKVDDPWMILKQIAEMFPPLKEVWDRISVDLVPLPRIPRNADYVLCESDNVQETNNYDVVIKFIKADNVKRYPTLKVLLSRCVQK